MFYLFVVFRFHHTNFLRPVKISLAISITLSSSALKYIYFSVTFSSSLRISEIFEKQKIQTEFYQSFLYKGTFKGLDFRDQCTEFILFYICARSSLPSPLWPWVALYIKHKFWIYFDYHISLLKTMWKKKNFLLRMVDII